MPTREARAKTLGIPVDELPDGRGRYLRTVKPMSDRFWALVDALGPDECWPWKGSLNPKGYGYFQRGHSHGGCDLSHRTAFELANPGLLGDDDHVLHRCDNPPCCNPGHLFVGDNNANRQDSVRKLRHAYGQRHGRSKLKEADIHAIRQLATEGVAPKNIASRFKVGAQAINNILAKRTWKRVPG